MKLQPVVLSGGVGTRLWPLSRSRFPKQLQKLCGNRTMIQQTAVRLSGANVLPPIMVCNEEQRFIVAEQLREVGVKAQQIILEPFGRGTAAALAMAALAVKDPDDTILVAMPADHYIEEGDAFEKAVLEAAIEASKGTLMTLGIRPQSPHTGFGYIQSGASLSNDSAALRVVAFKEKPDIETAKSYVKSESYYWNAGIFIFRADSYLSALERGAPEIAKISQKTFSKAVPDLDFLRLAADEFMTCPNLSVDYAVMEKTDRAGVLPVNFTWSDIGSWASLWKVGDQDVDGNVIIGDVQTKNIRSSYIRSEGRLVAALGLENIILVETKDAVFVAAKEYAEEVKSIVENLQKAGRSESLDHKRSWRPWGYAERLCDGSLFQVNLVVVQPGKKVKLQYHLHRTEHWVVLSGTAKAICGSKTLILKPDDAIDVPLGVRHCVENPGVIPLTILEIQAGPYLGDDDVVRLDDKSEEPKKEVRFSFLAMLKDFLRRWGCN